MSEIEVTMDCEKCKTFQYEKGRADERERILGMVDYKTKDSFMRRNLVIEIDYDDVLNVEQVVSVIREKLKEQR